MFTSQSKRVSCHILLAVFFQTFNELDWKMGPNIFKRHFLWYFYIIILKYSHQTQTKKSLISKTLWRIILNFVFNREACAFIDATPSSTVISVCKLSLAYKTNISANFVYTHGHEIDTWKCGHAWTNYRL